MKTKQEQAKEIIQKVQNMIRWHREFKKHRDALALRKYTDLENEVEELVLEYLDLKKHVDQLDNQPNQTSLEL